MCRSEAAHDARGEVLFSGGSVIGYVGMRSRLAGKELDVQGEGSTQGKTDAEEKSR